MLSVLFGQLDCLAVRQTTGITAFFAAFLFGIVVGSGLAISARRKPLSAQDEEVYRQRNLIECMFAGLKDFRRVATRYDKLARNYLAGVLLAASTVSWA